MAQPSGPAGHRGNGEGAANLLCPNSYTSDPLWGERSCPSWESSGPPQFGEGAWQRTDSIAWGLGIPFLEGTGSTLKSQWWWRDGGLLPGDTEKWARDCNTGGTRLKNKTGQGPSLQGDKKSLLLTWEFFFFKKSHWSSLFPEKTWSMESLGDSSCVHFQEILQVYQRAWLTGH